MSIVNKQVLFEIYNNSGIFIQWDKYYFYTLVSRLYKFNNDLNKAVFLKN